MIKYLPCCSRWLTFVFCSLIFAFTAAADEQRDFMIPATDEGLPGEGVIRRHEWFQERWTSRRSAWAKTVEADQGAVVFLGDSISEGWGGSLGAAFPGMKVANRGIGGDTSRGVLIRLQEDVLDLDPAGIVLLIGTNDLSEEMPPEMIAGNLELILEAISAHNPEIPVVLCEVFPSHQSKNRPTEEIQKINELYRDLVKGNEQVLVLDTFELFDDGNGNAIPALFPDLLHLNESGYAKWAAALRPILENLELLPVEQGFVLEDGFEYLFNGYDLTGWGYEVTPQADIDAAKNWRLGDPTGAAEWPIVTTPQSFDGLKETPDGRFAAINGRLVARIPADYRSIQKLHTTRQFPDDFILKMEFRASPFADSGVYVRGPQLQCRDYTLAGPYRDLEGYKPQEWNELVITVREGVAHCVCNGEVLEESMEVPDTGSIGIEGDRGQMEYRYVRIKEL
ncbi:GDSL-type esterase/lipase family protein [Pelagicoccus sp. SDUM812002]|uniref:GDSL-type esterase/lipase family protein n=1 Tax=Pelagicoccus sp. SDUM812002 TaxID=3041266 RepID=UPI00280F58E3|nr:GDSL-type esterase/lipase family protein [Pelagicoccus sp. SDUM812002]MDQ8185029.1 GDSL-type esterase/lipase family protein [Pelagicoccus sp. SDUM812002]